MAESDPLEDYLLSYQEFYAEIPGSSDYLNDIDPAIYDEQESEADATHGLTVEQVSQIARDSLAGHEAPTQSQSGPTEATIFDQADNETTP